jgi:hypothetical protein
MMVAKRDHSSFTGVVTTMKVRWLPHTARAALTGLRKRGNRIETARGEDRKSIYRIVGSAAVDEREDHAVPAGDREA